MKRILTLILACLMLISIGFADSPVQMPPSMTMTSEDGTVAYTSSPCNYGWTYPIDTPDEWCGVDAGRDAPTSPTTYKTIKHLLLTEETEYMLDWGNNPPDQIEIIGWDNAVFQDVEHAGDYQDTYVEFADNLITLKPDHVYSIHAKWLDGEANKEAHGNASYYIVTEKGSGDGAYTFDSFTIIESQGKYGISDPGGHLLLLPVEYYIPTDQFDPDRQPVCVQVYFPVDGDFNIKDLDWELDMDTVKAGFFHVGSGYFSQCIWKSVFASDEYVSVRDENDRYSLLKAETGEVVLDGNQYAWINPYESENWVYVWLWPDEMDENLDPVWDIAYINLVDGTILNEPDGYHFSEEYEPIVNGSVIVYDETGREFNMQIEDILQKD